MAITGPSEDSLKQRFLDISKALQKEYGYTREELYLILQDETSIPASVFSTKMPPLQGLVKYLQTQGMDYQKISTAVKRSYRAVWGASKGPVQKFADSNYKIPLTVFNDRLSVLESVVKHMREHYELRFSQIGKMLNKDQRTIWTAYSRAGKKK